MDACTLDWLLSGVEGALNLPCDCWHNFLTGLDWAMLGAIVYGIAVKDSKLPLSSLPALTIHGPKLVLVTECCCPLVLMFGICWGPGCSRF